MISTWWLYLLVGLVHYVIRMGVNEKVLVMTNNIMNLGYTYAKLRLKKIPDIL